MLDHPANTSSTTPNNDQAPGYADVLKLIRRQPKDHSLLQPFYVSPDIYRLDMERFILPHWHCVGHVSQVPKAGDYFLFELDRESVIIIRGHDGVVRALANVCRHRGSRICSKPSGQAKSVLVCPYHAWAFKLDGTLRNARMMPDDFDVSNYSLRQLPLKVIEGLMFLSLVDKPPAMNEVEKVIRATAGPFGWADAKVVHSETITMDANWKLALENQVECYHCGPAHPEFSKVHSQGRTGAENTAETVRACLLEQGIDIPSLDQWALRSPQGEEAVYCSRYAMFGDAVTASEDGRPVAPLMGRLTKYDGGFTIFYVGPLNHFLAYADYGAIFRYTPRSVHHTELHVTWLVRGDAKETDFDVDRVTWLWRVTAGADKRIVEENQIGVNSRYYEPGPYALPIESNTQRLAEWYLHEIGAKSSSPAV